MRKILLFFLLLCLCCCKENQYKFEKINFVIDSFDWDTPYKFSSYITDSVLTKKGNQYASWDYSSIGNIKKTLGLWDGNSNRKIKVTQETKEEFELYTRHNAVDFILTQARDKNVVIINEAHHMPQHRVFTTQLLEGLSDLGFKHLGLETYFTSAKNDSTFLANGYPTLRTGFYTKEPQFGNLLREAYSFGYKLFGYESQDHNNGREREINQAKNIAEYLRKFPNEKILIHCGFDHVLEGDLTNKWEKAMAARLTEYTNIDPLTIDQVVFSEKGIPENEHGLYQLFDHNKPSVFLDDQNGILTKSKNGGSCDIFVFHPRSGNFNRPSWLIYDDRKELNFNFDNAEINCPCLVFAYKDGEQIGSAVPFDIQETQTKNVNLILDNSKFNIVILNEANEAVMTELSL